ncbi:Uncharacterized membrane protein YgdD, TMEM256/DUF423 family [Muriicola jejuensis]|uniref:DUF423 domain-containing protein n=1 Tax=Muriicola jejuensis TaxID=504488 RepID=A0A6P0UEM7_9FLAO|nr:DUF423 domain-containing protein [Muriicola jejuensis]NER09723.1 DUF423 domain-containing protein [Muriicola jejuensis]SMP06267.1 Uncharacterized membrane protein YgdD, TMEM256/DUF423 family [Muriicola jejuensis]
MILLVQVVGALYGFLAVLFGAFGAHALKKSFDEEQLKSFETGVKYQMYHGLLLIVLGFNLGFNTPLESYLAYCFIFGTLLFSFSIYGLCITGAKGRKWKFLGPVTPLGGLLLLSGWALLFYSFIEEIV